MSITKIDCSTKAAGTDTAAVKTHLTINWEGMEQADLIALAQQTIVIKVQAAWRRAESIPGEVTINAKDYKVGTRAVKQAADPVELAKKMTPEQLAALIEKLSAMANS
ncbi:MAG: hypothetical protein ACHQWH_03730 [Nitrososphaerales archaeon]